MEKNDPSPYAQKLDQMLGERGAYDGETDAYAVLYGISLDLLTECSALRATEDNLRAQIGQGEPVAWLVCSVNKDGSLSLEHAASWQEAAHEHINDAITEHGIADAASWVVRPAYTHPAPQQMPLTREQRDAAISVANRMLEHGAPMSWEEALIDAVEAAHNIGEKK